MKKILKVSMIVGLTIFISTTSLASREIKLTLLGRPVVSDVSPFIKEERTLAPVRVLAEGVGAKVTWNQKTQEVKIQKDEKLLSLKIGSKQIESIHNNEKTNYMIDVAPIIKNNRTFLPVRAISEALGLKVSWDNETSTVAISDDIDYKKYWLEREQDHIEDMILSKPYDENVNYIDRLIELYGTHTISEEKDGYYYLDFNDFRAVVSEDHIKRLYFDNDRIGKTITGIGVGSTEADINNIFGTATIRDYVHEYDLLYLNYEIDPKKAKYPDIYNGIQFNLGGGIVKSFTISSPQIR